MIYPLQKTWGLMFSGCFLGSPSQKKTAAQTQVVDFGHPNAESNRTTRIDKGGDSDQLWTAIELRSYCWQSLVYWVHQIMISNLTWHVKMSH